MINLLSPVLKEQIAYAKLNAKAMKYVKLLIFLMVVISVSFAGATYYLNRRLASIKASFDSKQQQIASYHDVEKQAAAINDRVAAIKSIQDNQPHFSTLLSDLAQAMPRNAALDSLNLTGDDKKPIRVTASADTYTTAVALRDALAQSPRVSGVDIETVSNVKDGVSVTLTIAFKPGQAK